MTPTRGHRVLDGVGIEKRRMRRATAMLEATRWAMLRRLLAAWTSQPRACGPWGNIAPLAGVSQQRNPDGA